ncbi:MAG: zinc ribbon domain-containing protein, partial [Dehalococcoidia bacterium]
MFCAKCGAEIPDNSVQCSSCGTKVSGEAPAAGPGALSMLSLMIKADPTLFLTMVGSLLIILGAFLPWVAGTAYYGSALGVEAAQGAVIHLVGVLLLAVLVLSRSGAAGTWGVVMVLLTAL